MSSVRFKREVTSRGPSAIRARRSSSPPATKIYIIGGGVSGPATTRNPQSAEVIDLTTLGGAAWSRIADLNFPRTNVNSVLLPDGTILLIGGQRNGNANFIKTVFIAPLAQEV